MSIYTKLFKTCSRENLSPWECPNFVFTVMGVITIGIMITTYFVSRYYLSIELVTISVVIASIVFLVLGYSISQGVRRLGEARLSAEFEKAKTESIIQHLSDGLIMLDRSCRVALVNPRAEEYFGIKERDVLGKDVRSEPEDQKFTGFLKVAHWCPTEGSKVTNKIFREEFSIYEPTKRILRVQTSTVQDQQNNTIGYIKVLHDVTREKELDEIKSDFISIASHQLKTPLSTIKWNLEVLGKEHVGKCTEEQKNVLSKALSANEELIEIVRDLLDVSRIEQGKVKPDLTLASLPEIINEIIESHTQLASTKNIELISSLPDHDIKFKFDASSIKIVISNLVDNALKYTPGHGTVTASLEYVPDNNPKFAKVSVQDTGVGIPPAEQQKLFSKFYRGTNIAHMDTKGTGLGLYISKNIINLHKGTFDVKSNQGKGSTFSFQLPLKLH